MNFIESACLQLLHASYCGCETLTFTCLPVTADYSLNISPFVRYILFLKGFLSVNADGTGNGVIFRKYCRRCDAKTVGILRLDDSWLKNVDLANVDLHPHPYFSPALRIESNSVLSAGLNLEETHIPTLPHLHIVPPLPPDRDTKWSDPCSLHMQRTAYWCFQSRLLIFTSTGRGVRVCGRCNVYRSWCWTWVKGAVSLGYHSGGFLPMLSKSLHTTHPLLINSSLVCFFTQQ